MKTTNHPEDPGSFPCRSQSRTPNKDINIYDSQIQQTFEVCKAEWYL